MVLITGYKTKKFEDKEFYLLELQGEDIEVVISQTTGMPYATSRKTFLPTTFSEQICTSLIGKQLPGSIIKRKVEPYTFKIEATGEEKIIDYSFTYNPKEEPSFEEAVFE